MRRALTTTPHLDQFTHDPTPAFPPASRKRNGSIIYSTEAKLPQNSPHIQTHVYSAQHPITGTKPNVSLFQDPNNTLDNILAQITERRTDSRNCRQIIFISDFQLCHSDSLEATLDKIDRIYDYVESHGHVVTFAFLPYVPAYSKDPKCKTPTSPNPDLTDFLIAVNNKIQELASANPIKQAFSNKSVGYNSGKTNYKATSWRGYKSNAPEALRFACCYTYTDRELVTRSLHFFNHVEKFIDSLR